MIGYQRPGKHFSYCFFSVFFPPFDLDSSSRAPEGSPSWTAGSSDLVVGFPLSPDFSSVELGDSSGSSLQLQASFSSPRIDAVIKKDRIHAGLWKNQQRRNQGWYIGLPEI